MSEDKTLSLSDIMNDTEESKDTTTEMTANSARDTTVKKYTPEAMEEVSLADIVPEINKPKPTMEQTQLDGLMGMLNDALERDKRKVDEALNKVREKHLEIEMTMEEAAAAGEVVDTDNLEEVLEVVERRNENTEKKPDTIEEMESESDILFNEDTETIVEKSNDSINETLNELDISNLEDDEEEVVEDVIEPAREEAKESTKSKSEVEPDTVPIPEDYVDTRVKKVEPIKTDDIEGSKASINPADKTKKFDDVNETPKVASNSFDIKTGDRVDKIDDADLEEFLNEDTEETEDEKEERKAIFENYKKEVFDKIQVVPTITKHKVNKIKIATTPISVQKALRTNPRSANTATWVLPNSGRLITFSALAGEEIENLSPASHDNNMSEALSNRLTFNTLFNHLIDANKPDSMEKWLRTINWYDINDIYFAIYLATFKNTNFVTYTCSNSKCNHMFLEQKSYKDMISYEDDKAEELYKELLKKGIDTTPDYIEEEVVRINDKYAIGFRAPSIYDIMFGASSLDENFRTKYATTIGNISYMANMYYIADNNGEEMFFPIDCKAVENDSGKTMRNKIIAYYNILKTLSSDEYSVVSRAIADINNNVRVMASYHYPDHECPKCHTLIERKDDAINPLVMVFIRHQLVRFANSLTE